MIHNRIAVFTSVFQNYDILFSPRRRVPGVDYIAFTDHETSVPAGWMKRVVSANGDEGLLANRRIKILCHHYLFRYEYSVHIDGNIRIKSDISSLLEALIASGAPIGLVKHADRANITDETLACLQLGKAPLAQAHRLDEQVKTYLDDGLPNTHVLTDNGVVFSLALPFYTSFADGTVVEKVYEILPTRPN